MSSGETVTSVAQKFNMSVDSLRKLNLLRSFARGFENLRPGDELDVPLSPLPKVMWDESTAAGNIGSDQQAQNVAAITSQAGSFVAGGASKDAAASMARGMATVTLSNWSTSAESAVYEITPAAVITLKEIAVNGYNFAPDAGFPTIGFIGAKFSLVPSSGSATDYTWSADAPWVTVNDGVVSFTGVGSRDKVTITGTPKGDGDEITWSFSLTSWFAFGAGDVTRDEANNYCNNMAGYSLATDAQLTAGNGALRGLLGSFWSEWGNAWLADDYVWSSSYNSSNGSKPVFISMENGQLFQWTGGGWGPGGGGDIIAGCRKDL
ncbi:LysM peptidoglycan-binding domain-containing protein [Cedecea davisae]|uniref:LysM peptidoglycan-binding domain-containing protein n=2 Tax=Cedecea davisae TaxID=158484 RepID=A0ABS6DF93_9ENTR|nr:LysM peptidoglycan-binding domain-containing protein [Cedecea davisae]MBU4681868.1 LysM peptidoglycan-binding domain-containing protein [Cedecea davisae]MBU4686004.1 LysM peptidoglycan-binding domain-containing protein [Cedecea davisae]